MSLVSVNLSRIGGGGPNQLCFVESTNKLYGTCRGLDNAHGRR